jgi:hypothetical protein
VKGELLFGRPLLSVLKFLNDSTYVFKKAEITLNINKTIFDFLQIFFFNVLDHSANFIGRPRVS